MRSCSLWSISLPAGTLHSLNISPNSISWKISLGTGPFSQELQQVQTGCAGTSACPDCCQSGNWPGLCHSKVPDSSAGWPPRGPVWRVALWGPSCRATPGSPLWVAVPELAAGCACWLWPGSSCLKPIIICVILTAEGTDLQSFFLVRHNHQPDLSCLAGMHTR